MSEQTQPGRHIVEPGSQAVRDALDGYSYPALTEILDALQIHHDATTHRHEAHAYAASFLGSPEHAAILAKHLSPRLAAALAATPFRAGHVTLRALKVRLAALGDSPTSLVAELRDLLVHGAIVFSERPRGKEMISLNERLVGSERQDRLAIVTFPAVLALAAPHAGRARGLDWGAEAPPRVRTADFHLLQREVYLSLRAVLEDRLRVTARGTPFKHDVVRIPDQPPAPAAAGRGRARRVPAAEPTTRTWFALSLLFASPAVELAASRAVATPAARAFLADPPHAQARFAFDAYRECVFSEFFRLSEIETDCNADPSAAWVDPTVTAFGVSDVPTWPRLKAAREAVLAALSDGAREGSEWIAVPTLETAIRADHPDFLIPRQSAPANSYWGGRRNTRFYEGIRRPGAQYPENLLQRGAHWAEVEGAYIRQVLVEPLHWLGLLDLGFDGDDAETLVAVRLTPLGRHLLLGEPAPSERRDAPSAPRIVVQPNFDVVVLDAVASLDLLSRLDDFAERTSLDRAATYRLTRDAAVRGFERGVTSAEMIATLESTAAAPLPQNVRYSIAEWARLFERVHVRRAATLLVADSEAQLDGWFADPDLRKHFGRRLSPTTLIVAEGQRDDLQRKLRQRKSRLRVVDYKLPQRGAFVVRDPGVIDLDPKSAEPYLRYRVAAFADPAGVQPAADASLLYRLTAGSVRRALANGLKAEAIVGFLNRGAIGPLPPDTLLRVRGWGGAFGPLRHAPVVAFELPPGLSWGTLTLVPEVERALVRVASPTIGLLDAGLVDAVRAALAERGIDLREGLGPTGPAAERRVGADVGSSADRGITLDQLLGEIDSLDDPPNLTSVEAMITQALVKHLRLER